MYTPLKRRIELARSHATHLRTNAEAPAENSSVSAALIVDQLGRDVVVNHSDGIVVTDVGFVTMALLTGSACYCGSLLVVPGVDERAQRGHLVLRKGFLPFHSTAANREQAAIETTDAHERAAKLVEYFGSRQALKQAALSAPWYLFSRPADVDTAGLCQWGTTSFLRRYGLLRIAMSFGLPRIVLRLAGSYGIRITAATKMRQSKTYEAQIEREADHELLESRP